MEQNMKQGNPECRLWNNYRSALSGLYPFVLGRGCQLPSEMPICAPCVAEVTEQVRSMTTSRPDVTLTVCEVQLHRERGDAWVGLPQCLWATPQKINAYYAVNAWGRMATRRDATSKACWSSSVWRKCWLKRKWKLYWSSLCIVMALCNLHSMFG